ncbi:PEP-CTERM sorting domain-containing protein [Paludisphaera soli]|uniref:PEP-CTERM sorting domain-containing protein n=1 Tax=Paludisphaera soli TaxID=2712865 RepID=UPI0013E9EF86|nr:PEP-CTERM sorting domain-containing protein [Paludisphaera soli]
MRLTITLCLLAVASQAEAAGVTYHLISYAADQDGATLSGYFTLRPEPDDSDFSTDDVLDWSVTISQGGASYTTGVSDPSSLLTPVGNIRRTAAGLTIAPGQGGLLIQSDAVLLSYSRLGADEYSGGFGPFGWDVKSPSMGGTDPWVIARTLGAPAVPEPSTLTLGGIAAACAGAGWSRRRSAA